MPRTHLRSLARPFLQRLGSNCSATGMGGSVGTQERPIPHLSVGRGMVLDLVLIVFSTRHWPFSGVQIFVGGGTTFSTRKVFIYIYIIVKSMSIYSLHLKASTCIGIVPLACLRFGRAGLLARRHPRETFFFVLLCQQLLGQFLRQGILVVFLDFVQLLRTGTLVCVGVRSMWSLLRWTTAVS